MALTAAELIKADQEHLIHPLHHPIDNAEPMIYVRGRGATISDIGGKEYLDGLSGLWNVNVGHGRTELADAAAQQMKELAYFSGYVGSSSVPAITLASRLVELAGDMAGIFFTTLTSTPAIAISTISPVMSIAWPNTLNIELGGPACGDR